MKKIQILMMIQYQIMMTSSPQLLKEIIRLIHRIRPCLSLKRNHSIHRWNIYKMRKTRKGILKKILIRYRN